MFRRYFKIQKMSFSKVNQDNWTSFRLNEGLRETILSRGFKKAHTSRSPYLSRDDYN
jgi:hypothetical protein